MRPVYPAALPYAPRGPAGPSRHRNHRGLKLAGLVLVFGLMVGALGHHSVSGKGVAYAAAIRLGTTNRCLDVYHGAQAAGAPVDVADCNGTPAQRWTTTATAIHHGTALCLAATATAAPTLQNCSGAADQVWLRQQAAFYNPASDKCLATGPKGAGHLTLATCTRSATGQQNWSLGSASRPPACGGGDESARLACAAASEWAAWTAAGSDHEALLAKYTDGTPYEAWCADFISYLYKQAGHPFTAGSADGWDQNDANQIQNMGFIRHDAGSGYVPRTGDVAFFSYPGGHVELVISGGPTPTFLYGDSATIDPATGNGQMKANTITQAGEEGRLLYYLSPVTQD